MAENEGLIVNILTSFGIAIPTGLTEGGFLRDMEERLTDFTRLRNFLSVTKPSSLINEASCRELFNEARNINTEVAKRLSLSKGELWILTFLKGVNDSDLFAFIKMIGPLYYAIRVAKDIEKNMDALTNNLKAAIFIYLFQNLYELLLSIIDSCLYIYLNRAPQVQGTRDINNYRKKFIEDRKLKRGFMEDRGEHATAGLINGIFSEIYIQECSATNSRIEPNFMGDTIFNTLTRDLRNASAHFNAFYDEKINKIVFLDGTQMSMEEFVAMYERLFIFLYRWMELYLTDTADENAFVAKIEEEAGRMLDVCLRQLQQIERGGRQKYWGIFIEKTWGNSMVRFKEKREQTESTQ